MTSRASLSLSAIGMGLVQLQLQSPVCLCADRQRTSPGSQRFNFLGASWFQECSPGLSTKSVQRRAYPLAICHQEKEGYKSTEPRQHASIPPAKENQRLFQIPPWLSVHPPRHFGWRLTSSRACQQRQHQQQHAYDMAWPPRPRPLPPALPRYCCPAALHRETYGQHEPMSTPRLLCNREATFAGRRMQGGLCPSVHPHAVNM